MAIPITPNTSIALPGSETLFRSDKQLIFLETLQNVLAILT